PAPPPPAPGRRGLGFRDVERVLVPSAVAVTSFGAPCPGFFACGSVTGARSDREVSVLTQRRASWGLCRSLRNDSRQALRRVALFGGLRVGALWVRTTAGLERAGE